MTGIPADKVSAVLVTKGDVDLDPILDRFPEFDELIIWDNSKSPVDMKTLGRHLAEQFCRNDVIYHQDDDLIFRNFGRLLEAYEPGRITANMPSPWYETVGYPEKRQVMLGAGSLIDKGLAGQALDRYLAVHPFDDDLLVYCDCVVGALVPSFRVDLGYEILPWADKPGRISTLPGCWERKAMMDNRAFQIRAAA
jgi:hypothetical protein